MSEIIIILSYDIEIKVLHVVVGSHHFVDGDPAMLADPAPLTLVITVDYHVSRAGETHESCHLLSLSS